jgi:hypothetical protein
VKEPTSGSSNHDNVAALDALPEVDVVFDHGHRDAFDRLIPKVRGVYVMDVLEPVDVTAFREDVAVHCFDGVVVVEKMRQSTFVNPTSIQSPTSDE